MDRRTKNEIPNASKLLDIHTHNLETALEGRAIWNYEIKPMDDLGRRRTSVVTFSSGIPNIPGYPDTQRPTIPPEWGVNIPLEINPNIPQERNITMPRERDLTLPQEYNITFPQEFDFPNRRGRSEEQRYDKDQVATLPSCYFSAGIHPWYISNHDVETQFTVLHRLIGDYRLLAIGEAGLDKLTSTPMEEQQKIFKRQVEWSEEYELPLIIHCVKAMDELLAIRKKMNPLQPWVWHGFRGKAHQAKQLIDADFYLSFGVHYAEEALADVPVDRLFIESDESSFDIEDILQRVSLSRGVEAEELWNKLHENIASVFLKRHDF